MMKNFLMDENGQGMVEYGLILALIAVAAIVVLTGLGDKVKGVFNNVENQLSPALSSSSAIAGPTTL